MNEEEFEDYDEYNEDSEEYESEPLELIIKDGKAMKKPETVEITVQDFEKLQKGLELLKEKYPEISKECFP